jgi:hypothetical protein
MAVALDSGTFRLKTGQDAERTTASATLPINSRPNPDRPDVAMTIMSTCSSAARRTISVAASP